MAETVRGINVVISGDTTKLGKALEDVNKKSKDIQSELRQVERLLRFDPSNTTLLAQKQQLLAKQIENTSEKLNRLKSVQQQVNEQFQRGEISEGQYRAFQREIEKTQQELRRFQDALRETEEEQKRIAQSTRQLETLFAATGKTVDNFSDALGSKLVNAIKNGTASSKQLDEAIKKIGQEALGSNVDLEKLKKTLASVDDGNSLKKVQKELKELSKEANEAKESVGDLGVELENVAGALVAGGGIAGAIEKALDVSDLEAKINVAFDVPESSKKAIKEAVRSIEAYGVDAEAALEGVRRQWALNKNASDEANTAIVKGAAAVARAYSGIDFTELIQETHEIASELNITNEEALGLVNSLLKIGFPPEQLDIIAEYGQQLQRAGFEAEEIQAIFAAGVETGTWNIDNLLDGLKEGRIRLAEFGQEVDKSTKELLQGTGISAKQLQEWGQAVAAGGDKGREAMQQVAKALSGVKDETKRNALGVAIFGTMWEDQGSNITETILNMDKHLGDAKNNTDNLKNTVAQIDESPAVKLQQAFQDLKTASEPLLGVIADVVSKIAEWVSKNPELAAAIATIASVVGILIGVAAALAPIFTAIAVAAAAAGVSIGAIIGIGALVVAAIVAIIAIGVLLWKNWDKIKAKAKELWNDLKAKWQGIKNDISQKASEIWRNVTQKWSEIKTNVSNTVQNMRNAIANKWSEIKTNVSNKIQSMKTDAVNKFQSIVSSAQEKFSSIKSKITEPIRQAKDFIKTQVDKIVGFFRNMKISFPKIKLPHFKLSGKFSLNPPSVPKISVDWYKVGGVFEKPVIFGNAGFGDVSEAIVPFEGRHARRIADLIGDAMLRKMQGLVTQNEPTRPIIIQIPLNGRVIAQATFRDIRELSEFDQHRRNRFR
ncbi:phage tail tape measure protein [Geobacillus thermodenitrificans]|uniref:phage tail tape measure protein n=1 Tax=Geobacillus thermodenitrificans TaxID=33940 RepID=UPI003D1AB6AE